MLKLRPFKPQTCGRMKQHRTINPCRGKGQATNIHANQVSHTMRRLRSTISTLKGVGNIEPPKCAKVKIIPQVLESEDKSPPKKIRQLKEKWSTILGKKCHTPNPGCDRPEANIHLCLRSLGLLVTY